MCRLMLQQLLQKNSSDPNPSTIDEEIGFPFPPLDEGALLATQTPIKLSQFFDGMDDEGKLSNPKAKDVINIKDAKYQAVNKNLLPSYLIPSWRLSPSTEMKDKVKINKRPLKNPNQWNESTHLDDSMVQMTVLSTERKDLQIKANNNILRMLRSSLSIPTLPISTLSVAGLKDIVQSKRSTVDQTLA
ncbi:hypothetical protein Pint_18497 [Pistacia integerrima]|uniref:Uncharacterized protein n=1 Tax=Pistacia integerrima TaxID=434235 RepID=A0ACC0YUD5_9ROSI|nr:hypothetical protein Pint_18497 [Pistacia integerrima]